MNVSGVKEKKQPAQTPRDEKAPPLAEFRAALDSSLLSVWSWDLLSHQLTWSTNLEDFHGPSENKLDGIFSLVPQDLPTQEGLLAAISDALNTGQPCRVEYRLPGSSGRDERWFEASATVLVKDGAPVQLLGMCREVTERLRVNREVGMRARQQETLGRLGEHALPKATCRSSSMRSFTRSETFLTSNW